jgi:hypothetical protein
MPSPSSCLLATNVYPKDTPIPPGGEWYYELGGRAHGPLSRGDLEDLLNPSGETASEVRVRHGLNGPWKAFQVTSSAAEAPGTADSESVGRSSGQTMSLRRSVAPVAARDFRELVRTHWDVGAGAAALVLLNVLYLAFWPQPYERERRYLQTLQAVSGEVQELRAKSASDADWRHLAERTRVALAPIVSDLKKSASASEPVRQQLLWAARDLIPRTLGPRTKERDEQERRLKEYLNSAQRELGP